MTALINVIAIFVVHDIDDNRNKRQPGRGPRCTALAELVECGLALEELEIATNDMG